MIRANSASKEIASSLKELYLDAQSSKFQNENVKECKILVKYKTSKMH